MKYVGNDEYDMGLTPRDGVLIGTHLFGVNEEDVEWKVSIIQKMTKEFSFMPKMIDYHFVNGALEYALEDIGGMTPIKFYLDELRSYPSDDNVRKSFAIYNELIHEWRSAINIFSIKNNISVNVEPFIDATVISDTGKLYFMNVQNIDVRAGILDQLHMNGFDTDKVLLNNYLGDIIHTNKVNTKVVKQIEAHKKDFDREKYKLNRMIKVKDKELKDSISKASILATLGEEQYNFYFGDSDG